QRAKRGALAARAAAAGVPAHDAAALVLLDDVELLLDELVGQVQGSATARGTGLGTQLVLLGLEMAGKRLSSGGPGLLLRCELHRGFLWRLRALLERASLLAFDDGW